MIKKHIQLTFRNMLRRPVPSGINIIGFAVGIVCVLVIGLWIQNETNFDKFHKNYNDIYRVTMKMSSKESADDYMHHIPTLFGRGFKEFFPEVIEYVRFNETSYE